MTSTPNPRTAPIIPGQECVVEIPKGTTGLGLSIVGGADTLLVRNIRVYNKTIMMMTTTAMMVTILIMMTMNYDDCSDDYDVIREL